MDKGFSSVHPFVCFLYYFAVIIFSMMFFHPVYLLLSLLGAVCFNLLRDGGRIFGKSIFIYIVLSLAVIVANPITSHRGRTILFYLFDNPVTFESFMYGAVMALSLLSILVNIESCMQVLDYHKFLHLFSSFLPRTAFVIMMTVRFIPMLRMRLRQISTVQKTREIDVSNGPMRKRARNGMQLLYILITWSLEEALQTAESMKARGYGLAKRSSFFDYRMTKHDWGLLMLILILSAAILYGWFMGYGTLRIYPALGPLLVKPQHLFFYAAFLLMISIPAAEEGREILIWHSLK